MKCSQCGSDAATGAGTCSGCGAAIPTAAEAGALTQAGPAMAFRFDAARWATAGRIAGSSLVKVSWDFGAFLGLAAAVVAVAPLAAALLRARSSRTA
jgi:hypothetical protein